MVFFSTLPPLLTLFPLTVFWSHLVMLTNHMHLRKRNIHVWISYIPHSLSLCISPSLRLSFSNTSCRARSWLIRALVANAISPSPTAEMNGDQMRSSYEVGSWVIGDTSHREEQRERWKWGGGRWNEMNSYSGMYPLLEVLWYPGGFRKHSNS